MKKDNINNFFEVLVSMCVQEKDEYTWFAASNRNGIYQISNKTHDVINKYVVENEDIYADMLYHNMEINRDKIFFAPHRAKKIAVFDIKQQELIYLDIKPVNEKYKKIYNSTQKFGAAFQDGVFVYLLGYTYPAIIKIHRETLEMVYINCWVDEIIDEISENDARGYFTMGTVKNNRKIMLPMGVLCGILELNLDTNETKLIRPNISFDGIGGIASDANKNVWMVGRGNIINKIVRWDIQNHAIKEIELPMDETESPVPFYEPICYKNKVYLFPVYSDYVYEIDVVNTDIHILEKVASLINAKKRVSNLSMCTFSPRIKDGKIKFTMNNDGKWYEYCLENEEIVSFFVVDHENTDGDRQAYVKEIIKKNSSQGVLKEYSLSLSDYIDIICLSNIRLDINQRKKNGSLIYSELS